MTVHQNVQIRRIKRRLPVGKILDEGNVRPSRREAVELLSALSNCNIAASALLAEMEHSLMLLKDARLEADTAVSIVTTSKQCGGTRNRTPPNVMSVWSDALRQLSQLAESFVLMKDTQKIQAQEISLLRQDNADLRRENARIVERLATLEEARKTTAAEVKTALTETLAAWHLQQKDDEIAELKRKNIAGSGK